MVRAFGKKGEKPIDRLYNQQVQLHRLRFDINEEFEKGGHMVYYRISAALVKLHSFSNVKDVLKLSVSQRVELMNELLYETDAEQWQLMKYLHLKKG